MVSFIRIIFLLGDIVFLNLSIVASYYLTRSQNSDFSNIVYLIIFSNLTWFFLVTVATPYSLTKLWDIPKALKNQLIFLFIHLLVVISLIFFYNRSYTYLQVALIYAIFIPTFYLWKLLALLLRRILDGAGKNSKNVLLISKTEYIDRAQQYLLGDADKKYQLMGQIKLDSFKIPLTEVNEFCDKNPVDEIVVCLPRRVNLKELIDFGLNKLIPIRLITDISIQTDKSLAELSHFNTDPFVNISAIRLDEVSNQIVKRIFDIVFSTIFIVSVLSWLLPIIAILIKIDSKGPVFFRQKRNGKGNVPFQCIKFRTMVVNKESDIKQATNNDPRITKIGKFLRKSSIDELPQFFNVFAGEMSLIGPRPHPIKLNEKFSTQIRKLTSRHYVKPGITGLAQAMGYRGETSTLTDMKNRVTLDRFYIENWSFNLDLKIIYLTIISLIKGSEKAY